MTGPTSPAALNEADPHQRAAELAREREAILSQLGEAVILTDKDGGITFVNEAAEQLHGVRLLGVGPDDYSETYHLLTEDGLPFPSRDLPLARAVRGETVVDACWRIRRPDGSEVTAVGSAKPLMAADGSQVGAVLTARDETERYRAEREVRENEARLRALTDHLPGGAVYQVWTSPDGTDRRFVFLSQSYEQIAGCPASHVLADPSVAYSAIDPVDQPRFAATEQRSIAENVPFDIQTRLKRTDGEWRWCRFISAPRPQPDGSTIWDGILIDVTDRVEAENALRDLNATLEERVAERSAELRLFRNIVQSDTSPVCAFDLNFRLIAFNRAHNDEFRRVNGFDTKIGDVFPDLFAAEQQPIMRALMTRALSGEQFTIVAEFGRPEYGRPSWEISYTPLRDDSGTIIGAFHHAKDISSRLLAERELAEAQEALRQSQKLESMGQLTGGVAHDFNNLLTPIIGSLDMLVRNGSGSERERRLVEGALQSAERAKTLVQRLLAFARRQPLQATAVDLGDLVRGMAGLLSSTLGPSIDIQIDAADNLPLANADPNQLEMALLNLAVNARDAMRQGGKLRIEAQPRTTGSDEQNTLPAGDYVVLCVTDSGIGMDELTVSRAIEPFFSTKEVGEGTGLGLSMVHGLAAQLGGGLTIDSVVGRGTTIELWLPVSAAPLSHVDVAEATQGGRQQSGVVLLVDDEALVRMTTAEMLADLGYEVIEAGSADEALQLVVQGTHLDILVTDHLMPGMTGTTLAQKLRSARPDLPVLILSGYADIDGMSSTFLRLSKPFRNADLTTSLAAAMGADG